MTVGAVAAAAFVFALELTDHTSSGAFVTLAARTLGVLLPDDSDPAVTDSQTYGSG